MLGAITKMEDISIRICDPIPHIIGFYPILQNKIRRGINYKEMTILSDIGTKMDIYVENINSFDENRVIDRIIRMMDILNISIKSTNTVNVKNIKYPLHVSIPASIGIFLVEDDLSNISLSDIYKDSGSNNFIEVIQKYSDTVLSESNLIKRSENYISFINEIGDNAMTDFLYIYFLY